METQLWVLALSDTRSEILSIFDMASGSAPTLPIAGAADIYPLDLKYTAREKAKDKGIQTALHNLTLADKDGLTNKEIEAIPDIPDECFICYSQFNYRQNLSHYLVFWLSTTSLGGAVPSSSLLFI